MGSYSGSEQTLFERVTRAIGLYFLAPFLLILTLPYSVQLSQKPYWGMQVRDLVVVSTAESGPATRAGVTPGDRVLGVAGRLVAGMTEYYTALAGQRNNEPCSLLLEREGTNLSVEVTPTRPPRSRVIWGYSTWLSGIAFLLMGVWVLSRRNDAVARNFFVLSMIFAFFLADIPDRPHVLYLTFKEVIRDLFVLLLPAYFLRFMLHFPSAGTLSARQKRRHRLLLAPVLPLFLLSLYAQIASLNPAATPWVMWLQYAVFAYFTIYFIAGLVIFASKILRRDRPIQHTKMRVVLFGLLAGLTPFLAGSFLGRFLPGSPLGDWQWLGFFLVLVPLSFGLAILRYGALDTAFVVRYSLTYGALTILLVLTYVLVVGLLGRVLTAYFQISTRSLATLTLAVSALLILPIRRAVQGWIDQTFYPSRRANRMAILKLAHELSGLIESQSAAQTLLARLASLYRPERLSLFLRDKEGNVFSETAGIAKDQSLAPVFTLSRNSALVQFLDRARRPVFAEDLQEWLAGDDEQDSPRGILMRMGVELLVPLVTGNKLSGFLAFGPKGGGGLYTQDDLTNLRLLCIQAAALLESQRLYQESLARKQLETELAVAQEIQAQLLPKETLALADIQICGRMQSCREVGGDYFDYFPLDDQTIGFAIADVAGKGIPAALLMSTLRVTFHGEALRSRDPHKVAAQLNQAFCDLVSKGQFISFFYGTYAIGDRCLRYSNAGMEPPILFRRRQGYLESLRKGGPVLGINPDQRYRCGTLKLEAGDHLVCFSDGLTEQTNETGDFFDARRVIETARDNLDLPLEELRETILTAVKDFGGPEQSDDRTIMLLKVYDSR